MKIGFFQYDVAHNRQENLERLQMQLERYPCDMVILPELSMCGYLFSSQHELLSCAEPVPSGASTQATLSLSKQYSCTIVFGVAEKECGDVFNTAVVVSKGSYVGKYRKIHLSDYEKKFFQRGAENGVFDIGGIRIGVQICFDLWFPEISREQIRQNADLLCVIANFGGETTYQISKIRAIENVTPLLLCNRVGHEKTVEMDADFLGKSTIVDASGKRLCVAPEHKECFIIVDMKLFQKRSNVICSDFDAEIALHY